MSNFDSLTVSLGKAYSLLNQSDSTKSPNNRERIFYANLVEAFKLTLAIRHLMTPVKDQRLLTSEPVEVLARLLFERSLLVRRLEKFEGEEPFLRFLKTSDASMAEKWSTHQEEHADLEAKQLPSYKAMADDVDVSGESARTYQQMSHLAHPKTSIPYFVAEATQCKLKNITPHQYFDLRCSQLVPVIQMAMDHICDVSGRELKRFLDRQS